MRYFLKPTLFLVGLCLLQHPLQAERTYSLGGSLDLVGAIDDNPQVSGFNLFRLEGGSTLTYGMYPSLILNSRSRHSELMLSYSFGLHRLDTNLNLNSESHSMDADFKADITRKLSLRITDRFRNSPDFNTFNFFRGIVFTPDGSFFDFETLALRRNAYENNLNLNLSYEVGTRSLLSLGAAHSVREFESDPQFRVGLTDQNAANLDVRFSREWSTHTRWGLGYRLSYFDFEEIFNDVRVHDMNLGLNRQLSPSVSMGLNAGPSYNELLSGGTGGSEFFGYNADLNIIKSFEDERISLYYRRRNGASTGLGSLSKTQQIGLNFERPFGPRNKISLGMSLYDTKRIFDNPFETRGLRASLIWSYFLTESWLINVGGSYRTQEGTEAIDPEALNRLDLERRRAFISLRFVIPEFWRIR